MFVSASQNTFPFSDENRGRIWNSSFWETVWFFFFRYKKLITSGWIFYIIGWLFSRTAATKWCSNTLLKWFLHNRSPLIYGCRRAHFGLPNFFTFVWRPLVFLRPRQLPMSPMPRAGPGCARIVKQFAEKNNNLDVLGDYFSIMIVLLLISDYHGQLKSLNWFVPFIKANCFLNVFIFWVKLLHLSK